MNKLELVDEQLAYDLAKFGNNQNINKIQAGIIAFSSGAAIGLLLTVCDQHLLLFKMFVFVIVLSIAYTNSLSMSLVKTFSTHDYDQIWRDFKKTLFWCKSWAPFSGVQLRLVSIIQNETLINQGRFVELEAITRVQWAHDQRDSVWSGIPKKIDLANVLAISYIGQKKYDQAIYILEHLSKTATKHYLYRSILYSLAYCYLENGQSGKASDLIEKYEKVINQKPLWGLTNEHDLVRARIELGRGQIEEASQIMISMSGIARNAKIAPEFRAHYFRTLSRLREAQNRSEESELHLQTAIDIIHAAPSLNLLSMAETYQEYEKFLERAGRSEDAICMARQSEEFEGAYLQKQLARLDDIRRLISGNKKNSISIERLLCESA